MSTNLITSILNCKNTPLLIMCLSLHLNWYCCGCCNVFENNTLGKVVIFIQNIIWAFIFVFHQEHNDVCNHRCAAIRLSSEPFSYRKKKKKKKKKKKPTGLWLCAIYHQHLDRNIPKQVLNIALVDETTNTKYLTKRHRVLGQWRTQGWRTLHSGARTQGSNDLCSGTYFTCFHCYILF